MGEPCERCPCPAQCFGHKLGWSVFCEWAAEDPPDPVRLRHICARSAMPERLESEPAEYPPLAQQAANLAGSLWSWAVDHFRMASQAEVRRRQEICSDCPQFDAGRCRLCGCSLAAKQRMRSEHCPLNPPKW